jgi:hypothetical protein
MPAARANLIIDDMQDEPAPEILGLADLAGRVFRGENLELLWSTLLARATSDPPDFSAAFDLSLLSQLVGRRDEGLELQRQILVHGRRFRRVHGDGSGLRLLVLMAPGDFMSNTPVDFLLEGSNVTLELLFLDPLGQLPSSLPEHDVAFLAVGECDQNQALLEVLAACEHWPRPTLNGAAGSILGLRRDLAADLLAGVPGLLAPVTARIDRQTLALAAAGQVDLADHLGGNGWPVIARPVGSHAGLGLERIDAPADLTEWLAAQVGDAFYIAPFIDYRGPDGQFRKYRIVFVDGAPFLAHLAISEHWMVHYLNAGMLEDSAKRDEEALVMRTFDTGFAARHGRAFEALHARFGLDYFGIDCSETPDGRLLVFETDNALIVHDMDPPDIFPYKSATVRALFGSFQDLLARVAGS